MLKNILLDTAKILNRDDLIDALTTSNQNSQAVENDILRLISYFNFTLDTLCENYFNLINRQSIYSDNNKKIYYINFEKEPLNINKISKNNQAVFFSKYSKYVTVPEANSKYEIEYKFSPDRINDLNQKIKLPQGINRKIICYGIAGEFFASKNQFDKAEYWNNKFMFEIFKSKTSKDRRIKQTFTI